MISRQESVSPILPEKGPGSQITDDERHLNFVSGEHVWLQTEESRILGMDYRAQG